MIFDRLEPRLPIIGPAQGGRLSCFRLFFVSGCERHIDGALQVTGQNSRRWMDTHATMWNNER